MLTNQYNTDAANKFLEYLMSLTYNKKCADCEKNNPSWADLTHSLFICYECSALHRRLGANRARVKSTQMDSWSTEDLRRMYIGGNKYVNKIPQGNDFLNRYKDTSALVTYLDEKEKESTKREPGDAFMNLTRKPTDIKQGPGVIEKKARPKFSDNVESEEDDIVSRSTEKEEPVFEDIDAPAEKLILTKSSTKLKRSINPSRSPFSFSVKDHNDSESEED